MVDRSLTPRSASGITVISFRNICYWKRSRRNSTLSQHPTWYPCWVIKSEVCEKLWILFSWTEFMTGDWILCSVRLRESSTAGLWPQFLMILVIWMCLPQTCCCLCSLVWPYLKEGLSKGTFIVFDGDTVNMWLLNSESAGPGSISTDFSHVNAG